MAQVPDIGFRSAFHQWTDMDKQVFFPERTEEVEVLPRG